MRIKLQSTHQIKNRKKKKKIKENNKTFFQGKHYNESYKEEEKVNLENKRKIIKISNDINNIEEKSENNYRSYVQVPKNQKNQGNDSDNGLNEINSPQKSKNINI